MHSIGINRGPDPSAWERFFIFIFSCYYPHTLRECIFFIYFFTFLKLFWQFFFYCHFGQLFVLVMIIPSPNKDFFDKMTITSSVTTVKVLLQYVKDKTVCVWGPEVKFKPIRNSKYFLLVTAFFEVYINSVWEFALRQSSSIYLFVCYRTISREEIKRKDKYEVS